MGNELPTPWDIEKEGKAIFTVVQLNKISLDKGYLRIQFGENNYITTLEEQFNPNLTLDQIRYYFTSTLSGNPLNYPVRLLPYKRDFSSSCFCAVREFYSMEKSQSISEYIASLSYKSDSLTSEPNHSI